MQVLRRAERAPTTAVQVSTAQNKTAAEQASPEVQEKILTKTTVASPSEDPTISLGPTTRRNYLKTLATSPESVGVVPELPGAEAVVVGRSEALVVGVTAQTKVPCNQASCSGVNGSAGTLIAISCCQEN